MKKILLLTFAFLIIASTAFSQGAPVKIVRIANATTALGTSLSVGTLVYNTATNQLWIVTTGVISTATLTTASGSFSPVNGDGQTDLAEGTATTTTVLVTSSTGNNATLQPASASRAGLLPAVKHSNIETNNAKVTNATHSGDVTGSGALTIGADKVLDSHINWGTSTNMVSTADIPEQTNLWYTDSRVIMNSAVVANTAKTGITAGQTSAITANTAKTSYTAAAAVAANTAKVGITTTQASNITANNAKVSNVSHTGDVTGSVVLTVGANKITDLHIGWGVDANEVSTADIPEQTNLWYTDARVTANSSVAANTAKTGITGTQASAIAANTAKVGITGTQATAIIANTAKVSDINHNTDTQNLSQSGNIVSLVDGGSVNIGTTTAVAANTAKTGISAGQASAITANTSKISYTAAAAVAANTAKVGITGEQAADIVTNTAKISYTAGAAVTANTAKVGITTTQASNITANNAKVTNVSTQLSLGTRTTTSVAINTDGGSSDVIIGVASASYAGLMSSADYQKLASSETAAQENYVLYTETFSENDGTPTVHGLEMTAIISGGAVVSMNGSVLNEGYYSLTSTTLTIGMPTLQYDQITITYNTTQ